MYRSYLERMWLRNWLEKKKEKKKLLVAFLDVKVGLVNPVKNVVTFFITL